MERKELTCIGCPLGCALIVEMQDGEIKSITGNTCKRGEDYARKELTNPTRIVTSIVHVDGGKIPMVSVKTKSDIPKNKIFECAKALQNVHIQAPVKIGDVIIEDVASTGVAIIATKNVEAI